MSLILDALRKMDQERKIRRGPAEDLRPEVLRYRAEVKRRQKSRKLPVLAGVAVVALAIGAGVVLKHQRQVVADASATSVAAVIPAPAPAAPAYAAPPVATSPDPPTTPASMAQAIPVTGQRRAAPAEPPAASPAPVVSPPAAVTDSAPASAAHTLPVPERAAKKTAKAARKAKAEVAAGAGQEVAGPLPGVTISGIAYQDERNLRRAVVNGTLVAEGTEVAGARVVEIRENSVRLSRGGQLYEISLSSR